jgi:hypothetical protein
MVSVKIENVHEAPIKKMSLSNGPTPTIVGNMEEKNADFFGCFETMYIYYSTLIALTHVSQITS